MKYRVRCAQKLFLGSLPVWEEWIEMVMMIPSFRNEMSLPVWEEWIEILPIEHGKDEMQDPVPRSLPVWEEWIEMTVLPTLPACITVSSRMGRVD